MSFSLNYLFDRMAVPKKSPVSRNKEHTFLNESQPVLEAAVAKKKNREESMFSESGVNDK